MYSWFGWEERPGRNMSAEPEFELIPFARPLGRGKRLIVRSSLRGASRYKQHLADEADLS